MRKRSLTLLEVMIALLLSGVLLSTLFINYMHIERSKQKLFQDKEQLLTQQVVQLRLAQIFDGLLIDKDSPFYVEEGALNFYFEAGISPKPEFCGKLKAKLFLKDHKLCLTTFSKMDEMRTEIFLEDLKELTFQFFNLSHLKWESSWTKDKKELPSMIKIEICKSDKKKIEFAFFLSDQQPIFYQS